ncbi:hypothetical protein ACCO45_002280 [Purpureocillium lilacinum]|uniref:Uncharacterized protein n=1 Tax=Purpureocillium lilacinum TaxID=33203 RepID=A0ACC4EBU8_PURLI
MPSSDTSSDFELDPVIEASSSPDAPLTGATPTLPKWYRPPRWLTGGTTADASSQSASSSVWPPRWMTSRWSTPRWSQHRVPRAVARTLRPRLTWRYVLFSLLFLYVFIRGVVLRRPLLASPLPAYTGPHAVGAVDIEVPIADHGGQPLLLSNATFKATGRPAFELQSVLFTLYYPVAAAAAAGRDAPTPPMYWIPKPISLTARGTPASRTLTTSSASDAVLVGKDGRLPVVLFSHGDASSRTDYTNYLGELASRGAVVAAVEHRDGSCPGTLVRLPGEPDREVLTFRASELVAPVSGPSDGSGDDGDDDLKKARRSNDKLQPVDSDRFLFDQLEFRNAEMFQALHLLIAGHSHGATLALKSLVDSPLPASGGIALDPGKSSGKLDPGSPAPLLVVHSNSWSRARSLFFGRPHFDAVKELVRGVLRRAGAAWFVTSVGTSHPSVSDAPLIEPWILSWTTGARMNTKEALEEYVRISVDFMYFLRTGRARALLAEPVTHDEYDEWVSEERKQEFPKGMARLWQVHVSPAIGK